MRQEKKCKCGYSGEQTRKKSSQSEGNYGLGQRMREVVIRINYEQKISYIDELSPSLSLFWNKSNFLVPKGTWKLCLLFSPLICLITACKLLIYDKVS